MKFNNSNMTPTQPTTDEVKYVLIANGEGNDPATITICNTEHERELATREAIFGGDNRGIVCFELAELKENGIVHFEGDPSLAWKTAFIVDTHTAKLRAENEGLKSQNTVMTKALKAAQQKHRNQFARSTDELTSLKTPYDAALDGSTTPNAFDRVRELEAELITAKEAMGIAKAALVLLQPQPKSLE